MKQNIYDLYLEELKTYLNENGQPKYRAGQIFTMLHRGYSIDEITNIPKELREKLKQDFHTSLPKIIKQQTAKDGTRKFLLELSDGLTIECVLLYAEYGQTVCVSSQVGCKMHCAFCLSGRNGFIRNLSSGEILSQVILATKNSQTYDPDSKLTKSGKQTSSIVEPAALSKNSGPGSIRIVLMGSGEPLDNFDNTIKFIHLINHKDGMNISTRNISLSTVGLAPRIRKFADLQTGVNLCISLHAPNDIDRQKIIPMARKYKIEELIDSAHYYFKKTGRRVIFEYSLIDGVNCSHEHARELYQLVRGFPSHVNLILLNSTGGNLKPPSWHDAKRFMDTLIKAGVSCTFRKSKGDEIMAACGQLKGNQNQG